VALLLPGSGHMRSKGGKKVEDVDVAEEGGIEMLADTQKEVYS